MWVFLMAGRDAIRLEKEGVGKLTEAGDAIGPKKALLQGNRAK